MNEKDVAAVQLIYEGVDVGEHYIGEVDCPDDSMKVEIGGFYGCEDPGEEDLNSFVALDIIRTADGEPAESLAMINVRPEQAIAIGLHLIRAAGAATLPGPHRTELRSALDALERELTKIPDVFAKPSNDDDKQPN